MSEYCVNIAGSSKIRQPWLVDSNFALGFQSRRNMKKLKIKKKMKKITIEGKIERLGDVVTRQGRMGDYQVQGVLLQVNDDGEQRQSIYGSLFGQSIEELKSSGAKAGDRMKADAVFTTSERNGFVSNYVEFQNPCKL